MKALAVIPYLNVSPQCVVVAMYAHACLYLVEDPCACTYVSQSDSVCTSMYTLFR